MVYFKQYLVGGLLGVLAFAFLAWWFCDSCADARESQVRAEYAAAADRQAERVALANRLLHRHVVELGDKHLEVLFDERENTDRILDGVGRGVERVFIPAEKTSCAVQRDSPAASVADGEAQVELDGAYAEQLFAIAGYGDETAVMLDGLQDYVLNVCQSGGGDG